MALADVFETRGDWGGVGDRVWGYGGSAAIRCIGRSDEC